MEGGSDIIIALISAVAGGFGIKALEHFSLSEEKKFENSVSYREELRTDIHALRNELKEANRELDQWRKKYYELMDEKIEVESKYHTMLQEFTTLQEKYGKLSKRLGDFEKRVK